MPIKPKSPSLGPHLNYSTVIYPDPPSHDFTTFLVSAERMRRRMNFPPPLTVHFGLSNGMLGTWDYCSDFSIRSGQGYNPNLPRSYSDQMIPNVLRPAISMMGAAEGPPIHLDQPWTFSQVNGLVEYDHHVGPLVEDVREFGGDIPKFKPPDWALEEVDLFLKGEVPLTITLRELGHQPERNSNLDAWCDFADSVRKLYPVIIIRDTRFASTEIAGFRTYPRASLNSCIRAALYQRAHLNLTVQTGPIAWLEYTSAPYISFKQLVHSINAWGVVWEHGQPEGWFNQDHLEVGQQWPWSLPTQILTWADDTYPEICQQFERWEAIPKCAGNQSTAIPQRKLSE